MSKIPMPTDLRYALRGLARAPGFTLAAVLTLALGIGANTAIFSVADALFLRALPYPDGDRLVMLWDQLQKLGLDRFPLNYATLEAYKEAGALKTVASFSQQNRTVTGGADAERISAMWVTLALPRPERERSSSSSRKF